MPTQTRTLTLVHDKTTARMERLAVPENHPDGISGALYFPKEFFKEEMGSPKTLDVPCVPLLG